MMATKKPKPTPKREAPPAVPYEPTEAEKRQSAAFKKKVQAKTSPASIKIKAATADTMQIEFGHTDMTMGLTLLMDTFGVTEYDLANNLLSQIINTSRENKNQKVEQGVVNAALAAVHGIGPKDEAEALLATQMVGIHNFAMLSLQRARMAETVNLLELHSNIATKMFRTYAAQMEALKKYRSKGEQKVVVQHVHVNADKAAVQVNNNAPQDREGGGDNLNSEVQPYAPALEHSHVSPMRSPNEVREAVSVASGQGKSPVQDARGCGW